VLYRTVSATLHTAVSFHSISIGPASAATTSGFLLAALIERAQSYMPTFTALPKRASDYIPLGRRTKTAVCSVSSFQLTI